jgi:tRNA-binding EMAP/Myf-like protein
MQNKLFVGNLSWNLDDKGLLDVFSEIGEVLEVTKHPDADKLNVAKVNVGDEELQIVCGAPNLKVGQKVPVALVGAVLPGDFKIKEAEIRGIKSSGMICAEDELGLGSNHEGIMVLSASNWVTHNWMLSLLEKFFAAIIEANVICCDL